MYRIFFVKSHLQNFFRTDLFATKVQKIHIKQNALQLKS